MDNPSILLNIVLIPLPYILNILEHDMNADYNGGENRIDRVDFVDF